MNIPSFQIAGRGLQGARNALFWALKNDARTEEKQ